MWQDGVGDEGDGAQENGLGPQESRASRVILALGEVVGFGIGLWPCRQRLESRWRARKDICVDI